MSKLNVAAGTLSLTLALFALSGPINAQGVSLEWVQKMGGSGYDYGNGIAVDQNKNVYITGYFADTATFNSPGETSVSRGGQDIFIAKLDMTGKTVWSKTIGGSGNDAGNAIVVDTSGHIYVTGYFADTVDFDPGNNTMQLTASGLSNIFVCKLDNNGALLWAGKMGSEDFGGDEGRAIALDAAGNVYTTGIFYGLADFDPGTSSQTLINSGLSDVFVSKLDKDGNYVWAKKLGGGRLDNGEGIAVDQLGNVYTTGSFQRTADFDPGVGIQNLISGSNTYDAFISKLDSNGDFVWARQITGSNPIMGVGLALDTLANVYTTGHFTGDADLDPGNATDIHTSAGGTDIYVSKLDAAGNYVWGKQMGGTDPFSGDRGYGITTDVLGNAYVTGYFTETADFNPGTDQFELTSASGVSDIFIAKLDAAGNFRWAKQLAASTGINWGINIAVDHSSNVYSTGLFNGSVNFDPGPGKQELTAVGNSDIYVHKMMCTDTTSYTFRDTGCTNYQFFEQNFTESGSYTHILSNALGCDSTITLLLEIKNVEAFINVNGFELGTTEAFVQYQWFLNGAIIPGATERYYVVSENGQYTVAITNERGCTDTADAYNVTNVPVGISNTPAWAAQIKVYPNPATSFISVQAPVDLLLEVYALDGRMVMRQEATKSINVEDLEPGLYLLKVADQKGQALVVQKWVKM